MSKKLSTKELVQKIEKLTKAKMASEPVVSLDNFRGPEKSRPPDFIDYRR